MSSKKNKRNGWMKSVSDFIQKYWKALTAFATVASVSYGIGFKHSDILREREIMRIENLHSAELLKLKEEYMEKYYSLREQYLSTTSKGSTDGSKNIQRNY